MIAFDLICSNGHQFECWFRDAASFDVQKESRMINCPVCNDDQIEKVLSPFAIRKGGGNREGQKIDPREAIKMIHDYLDKHFEDVGTDFAKEALKIHYGQSEERNIKGTATPEEETLLKEEGINYLKIPVPKRFEN
jgi:hypothetical protein